jgi:hypothetical protein
MKRIVCFVVNKLDEIMSKYIPKRRIQPITFEWSSNSKPQKEWVNQFIEKKKRIESIPLENLTFIDLYKFPFHIEKYGSWVYDAESNFIFQFEFRNEETRNKVIDILNGDCKEYKKQVIENRQGEIFINGNNFITIRGWGNLTGCGALNLNGDYAAKIQDTLAEYIVTTIGI